jgi:hypothetical protein
MTIDQRPAPTDEWKPTMYDGGPIENVPAWKNHGVRIQPEPVAIEPRTRELLLTVRRGLLMIANAIADYVGVEKK